MYKIFVTENGGCREEKDASMLPKLIKERKRLFWLDIFKDDPEMRTSVLGPFGFHPLCLEDCQEDRSDPKLENYDSYLFLIMHAVNPLSTEERFTTTELEVFIGPNYLVTAHKNPIRSVDVIQHRLLEKGHALMTQGPEYLLYHILDELVENYKPIILGFDEELLDLEDDIVRQVSREQLSKIFTMKKNLLKLRRLIVPQRDTVNRLAGEENAIIHRENRAYFRDLFDNFNRIFELSDNYRDLLTSALEVYVSETSSRMNEVIKILTIVSTTILPLTFVTGLYGMNFKFMPELGWKYGYFATVGLMVVIAVGMITYFKHKKWF